MSDIFNALFQGKTLETEDEQFQLKLELDSIDPPHMLIRHRMQNAGSWCIVKDFQLTIIQNNEWHVMGEEQ